MSRTICCGSDEELARAAAGVVLLEEVLGCEDVCDTLEALAGAAGEAAAAFLFGAIVRSIGLVFVKGV